MTIFFPRVTSTNGERARWPLATRDRTRTHCHVLLAVTTATSNVPLEGDASGNTTSPPVTVPTLPMRTKLALPLNQTAPSTRTVMATLFACIALTPLRM